MIMTSTRPAMRRATRWEQEKRRELRSPAHRLLRIKRIDEALVLRQSRRELAGFYEGTMSLAHVIGQRHGRFGRQKDDATGELVRMR